MENDERMIDEELEDLRKELENFQQEKERVRKIVGKIGGVPQFNTKAFNIIFIVILLVTLGISVFSENERVRKLMMDLGLAALSAKILYMMYCQNRVNHFQLWMMSSLEWRINEMMKLIRKVQKKIDDD